MSTERRLAITKRVSLADISDGWTDACHAIVVMASNREQFEISDMDTSNLTNRQSVELQATWSKKHFVRGEVLVLDEAGEPHLTPMGTADIDDNTEIASRIFLACVGSDIDPKDIRKAALPAEELPNAEATTETSSSTA